MYFFSRKEKGVRSLKFKIGFKDGRWGFWADGFFQEEFAGFPKFRDMARKIQQHDGSEYDVIISRPSTLQEILSSLSIKKFFFYLAIVPEFFDTRAKIIWVGHLSCLPMSHFHLNLLAQNIPQNLILAAFHHPDLTETTQITAIEPVTMGTHPLLSCCHSL